MGSSRDPCFSSNAGFSLVQGPASGCTWLLASCSWTLLERSVCRQVRGHGEGLWHKPSPRGVAASAQSGGSALCFNAYEAPTTNPADSALGKPDAQASLAQASPPDYVQELGQMPPARQSLGDRLIMDSGMERRNKDPVVVCLANACPITQENPLPEGLAPVHDLSQTCLPPLCPTNLWRLMYWLLKNLQSCISVVQRQKTPPQGAMSSPSLEEFKLRL